MQEASVGAFSNKQNPFSDGHTVTYDRDGYRKHLEERGFEGKRLSDMLTRTGRAIRILGAQSSAVHLGAAEAVDALERSTGFEAVTAGVRGQLRRAIRHYAAYISGDEIELTRKVVNDCDAFDRAGYREILEKRGYTGKKLSDLLTRTGRVARILGSETFAQALHKPSDIYNQFLEESDFKKLSKDVRGQLRRALRLYLIYHGCPDPSPGRQSSRKEKTKSGGGKRASAAKKAYLAVASTRRRQDKKAGRPAAVAPAEPDKSASRRSKKKDKPMISPEQRKEEERLMQEFISENGITRCKSAIANGSIQMTTLGLE